MDVHEALKPIQFLLGTWISTKAKGEFPTIQPFEYCEELKFESIGQPMLNYFSKTWHATSKKPMHFESGFLRIKPGTNELAFMVAHNFGLTSLEEGYVEGSEITLESKKIERMSFAKDPAVLSLSRKIKYFPESNSLEIFVNMSTSKTPTEEQHLHIVYKKSDA